jgi:hypothetical protein
MAKDTHHGLAKPDDPIYQGGPVVGGKRFYGVSKAGKPATPPKATPTATPKDKTTE